jgi:phospholipid/cholesterol/gamma-HCH transport system ATP-binding protein
VDQAKLQSDHGKELAGIEPGQGIVVLRDVVKRFGNRIVLDRISLAVEKGRTTAIIGPSGCGKTVLIKHMIVLLRPTDGEVFFKGQRVDDLAERSLEKVRTQFGFLFQGGALFDSLTVAENVLFPVRQHAPSMDSRAQQELVKAKLRMVGLDGFQNYYPANLSGGQRKRAALARAIAMDPEVILYDEPTTGLDPIRADIINELVLKLQRELKVTSVVVTHDMKSVYKVADRIIMLHNGKIIADGNADAIRSHPHSIVQQFINGQVSEDDLAVLRMGTGVPAAQYAPDDFRPGPG